MAKPEKETLRHTEAFNYYLSLGADRSLTKVAEKFGVSEVAAANWSAAFKWQERVAEAETRISERVAQKAELDIAEMKGRHLKISKAVQGLFVKRLNDAVDPRTGKLKARAYKPTAMDAARWAELEQRLSGLGEKGGGDPDDLPAGMEGVEVETIERVLIERVTRLRRVREAPDGGDGLQAGPGQP